MRSRVLSERRDVQQDLLSRRFPGFHLPRVRADVHTVGVAVLHDVHQVVGHISLGVVVIFRTGPGPHRRVLRWELAEMPRTDPALSFVSLRDGRESL